MRFGSLSLLLALGSAGLAGCGGGGSLGSSGAPVDEGSYTSVPSGDALPASNDPSTYEPVPSSYDAPPDQSSPGGPGTNVTVASICAQVCADLLGLACPVTSSSFSSDQQNQPSNGQDLAANFVSPAECANACLAAGTKLPCADELAASFACILAHAQPSCDLLRYFSDQDAFEGQLGVWCPTSLVTYQACLGAQPQTEPPPDGTCMPSSCVRCADACARCTCQHDGDASACMMCN